MNIFALDENPGIAARLHFDKHVVKMILETAQLLCTAHHLIDPGPQHSNLYKKTHVNHPCSVWVRESSANYDWAYQLFVCLCTEYSLRYGKVHASMIRLGAELKSRPVGIPGADLRSEFAQAMPQDIKDLGLDSVSAYRMYYKRDKWGMMAYKLSGRMIDEVMETWNSF